MSISAFALIAGLVIAFRRQTRRSMDKRVEASITQIAMEASSLSNWWRVTAEWVDPQTGRVLTFRSRRIKYPPHYRTGERVVVHFDTSEPKQYRMEFSAT
jgi:hypothetical protein